MIRLRKNKLLPQQVSDLGAFLFVVTMIPVTYIWEVSKIPKTDSLKGLRLTLLSNFLSSSSFYLQVVVVSRALFSLDGFAWYLHMALGVVSTTNNAI